ncbi:MAG: peptidylprolyl isomerase [Bacteroidales bacterium]|nr:peptidylprolyl isomerase [Bacteroidales bacterium]
MKKFLFSLSMGLFSMVAMAQSSSPILMRIAGKPITRAEFEYAYNKNNGVEGAVEKKSIDEYLDMFINYKLKVAAAEALKMDTLKSFQEEFRTYRDMQLTPALKNQAFIDSVARKVYDDYAKQVGGEDLLTTAHILLMLEQTATDSQKERVAQRADSIYNAIVAGADFAEMARKFSQDPGSASKGGELPPIGKGMTLKEFETAAYALQAGQMSRPVLSPVGYHIIWMKERKPLDSYEVIYPTLLESLKLQGIEEAAAENRLQKLIAAGHTREAVMDSLLRAGIAANPDLEHLVQEYHDGLLLFEVAKKEVWDVAAQDIKGLERQFKKNKKRYAWKHPRFKGYIVSGKTEEAAQNAKKLIAKGVPAGKEMTDFLKEHLNKDSVVVTARGRYLVAQGENSTIDRLAFGDKQKEVFPLRPGFDHTLIVGEVLKKPKTYEDVKTDVLADHQAKLEKKWVEGLRKRFTVEVDKAVLRTVNQHK